MAIAEGTSTLPNDAAATPNYVFAPLDNATLGSGAFWLQRSAAAGDALAAKYVAGVGLYLWNGTTVDRAVPARTDATPLSTGTPAAGLYVQASSGVGWLPVRRLADLADGNTGTTSLGAGPMLYNGTTWDYQRGNTEGTLLADAARTANTSSATQTNRNGRGVIATLRVNAASGTGGLTLKIIGQEPIGGFSYVCLTASAAITATGTYAYELYPGSSTAGSAGAALVNTRVAGILPRTWFAQVVHGDASSYTYNVSYSVVV